MRKHSTPDNRILNCDLDRGDVLLGGYAETGAELLASLVVRCTVYGVWRMVYGIPLSITFHGKAGKSTAYGLQTSPTKLLYVTRIENSKVRDLTCSIILYLQTVFSSIFIGYL